MNLPKCKLLERTTDDFFVWPSLDIFFGTGSSTSSSTNGSHFPCFYWQSVLLPAHKFEHKNTFWWFSKFFFLFLFSFNQTACLTLLLNGMRCRNFFLAQKSQTYDYNKIMSLFRVYGAAVSAAVVVSYACKNENESPPEGGGKWCNVNEFIYLFICTLRADFICSARDIRFICEIYATTRQRRRPTENRRQFVVRFGETIANQNPEHIERESVEIVVVWRRERIYLLCNRFTPKMIR